MLRPLARKILFSIPQVQRLARERDAAVAEVMHLRNHMESGSAQEKERLTQVESLLVPEHGKVVFSHWGEDSIVQSVFREFSEGRYLDIGCYHPSLYSNTMALYRLGWSGVNIDPNPFMIEQCRLIRPKDVSLNVAVGASAGHLEYFNFHDWASSNTASKKFAVEVAASCSITVPEPSLIEVVTLESIFDNYFARSAPDFVNIDVEELDLEVLKSGNWEKYRPKVIAVEDLKFSQQNPENSPLFAFMREQNYTMFSRCIFTSFYIENEFNRAGPQFA